MADVLTVVAKVRAAKGKGDALAALLKEQVAAVRKAEPECLVYRPHRLETSPPVFLFYEQYRSEAAFEFHKTAPHLTDFRADMKGLLARPTEIELYRSLTD